MKSKPGLVIVWKILGCGDILDNFTEVYVNLVWYPNIWCSSCIIPIASHKLKVKIAHKLKHFKLVNLTDIS